MNCIIISTFFTILLFSLGTNAALSSTDYDTLNVLRSAWYGSTLYGWTGEPACTWTGVLCDNGSPQRVIALNAAAAGISGSIPANIGNLTDLTELYLQGNALKGPIPPELGQLQSLSILYLYNNALSGSIPSTFGNLWSLTKLNLASNNLSGDLPIELEQLWDLQIVNISNNNLCGDATVFANSTQIYTCSMRNNHLSCPSSFDVCCSDYVAATNGYQCFVPTTTATTATTVTTVATTSTSTSTSTATSVTTAALTTTGSTTSTSNTVNVTVPISVTPAPTTNSSKSGGGVVISGGFTNPGQPAFAYSLGVGTISEVDPMGSVILSVDTTNVSFSKTAEGNSLVYTGPLRLGSERRGSLIIYWTAYPTGGTVVFAGEEVVLGNNSIKFSMNITDWPFSSSDNHLEVDFGVNADEETCDGKSSNDGSGNHQISIVGEGGSILQGTFLTKAVIDGNNEEIDIGPSAKGKTASDTVMLVPYFEHYAELDPSFSVLLGKGSRACSGKRSNVLIIATASGVAVVIVLAVVVGVTIGIIAFLQKKEIYRKLSGRQQTAPLLPSLSNASQDTTSSASSTPRESSETSV